MKKKFSVVGLVFLAICTIAATIQWYSDQPSITRLEDSMVLAVERATPKGYRSITLASLRDYALNNVSITNYTIYSTNFWISNSYVSNYVVTNVYNDTYASNFFLTQNFVTNQYSTNVTITNWYAPDTYVSNFFNTNIYVNDTYVSNYFTTNIYNTVVTNVYDYLYVSNAFITNITAQKLTVQNIYANNGTFTNGITNLSLTANTIVKSDANRALASVPNGTGALTNDGSGNFGWSPLSSGGDQVWTNDGAKIIPITNTVSVSTFGLVSSNGLQSFKNEDPANVYLGLNAGPTNTPSDSTRGVFIGKQAGADLSATANGVMIGYRAGSESEGMGNTVAIGADAGWQSTNSASSVMIGVSAGLGAVNVDNSVFLGATAGEQASIASDSVFIGDAAGRYSTAQGSIFIGKQAGYDMSLAQGSIFIGNSTGQNRAYTLWIEGGAAAWPLIYGEFDNRKLQINGALLVTNSFLGLERTWVGPTNEISIGEWTYTANTPCAVTNIVEYASGYGNSALLSITNASSSNITFTVRSPIRIPYGETSRSYTITNGDVFFGSFRKGAHGSVFVPRGFYNP